MQKQETWNGIGGIVTDKDAALQIICGCLACFVIGASLVGIGTSSDKKEIERETIVYCVEQPVACKTKYNFYKLENK